MLKRTSLFLTIWLSGLLGTAQSHQDLHHLASYEAGTEGAAETVAFDPGSKNAFFTSNGENKLTIVSLMLPHKPALVKVIDLSPYGGGPNSVDVYNGIVAVACQASDKTEAGSVVFFNANGDYQNKVMVGALPDMLTFSPNGKMVLSANEGEPNDDYTVDPNGSISIIDISSGVASATVTTLDFSAYNDKKIFLMNRGIRIFGNGGTATVSQDLEPEFITITPDGSKAYVICQENNAFALIDLASKTILDLLPLGYKNHNLGTPLLESYVLNELVENWPELGSPVYDGGQPTVMLGGFSGLYYDPTESTPTKYIFYTVPDRGPNGDVVAKGSVSPIAVQDLRPYKLPNYQGRIVKVTLNKETGAVSIENQILLYRQDGVTPITGKGNIPGFDEVPVTYTDAGTAYGSTDFTDGTGEKYHALPYDSYGGDMEGIVRDNRGNFWICDENRPALYKFSKKGVLIDRFVPKGTSMLGSSPATPGTYGKETLPAVYALRRANRGFEAIAYDPEHNIIYAFIQSPIEAPGSSVRNQTDLIRILGVNAETGQPVSEYVYLLDRNANSGYSASRVDKIGDAVYIGDGRFLVIERDSEGPDNDFGQKFVFEVNLKGATNILNLPIASRFGLTIQEATLLSTSAGVTNETTSPFLLPATFTQTKIVDRNTANLDADFVSTFGAWDMIALDPSNQYIYIPHEVGQGAGLTRYNTQTGNFVTAMAGNNTNSFSTDPETWDKDNDDYGALDPAEWTPWGTVLTAEEWSGSGRLFEWTNPLMNPLDEANVLWRSNIPSVAHEGLKIDAQGVLYFVDEFNSGSIYKYVPSIYGDLSQGQTFVLVVDAYNGDPGEDYNHSSNAGATRTGMATWIPLTDVNGNALTAADPFDFANRGGRTAADELNGTPYGRPEDLEIVGNHLFCAITSENLVISIELISENKAEVKIFADQSTIDNGTSSAAGTAFARVDNLASDAFGNVYVIEDNGPGDIWIAKDIDKNGIAESIQRWASLGVAGSEPTGLIATSTPGQFLVCIQHPSSDNDALWMINTHPVWSPDANPTVEQNSSDELYAMGIQAVHKTKVLNLPTVGYRSSDKAEGIALLPNWEIAILNDNDFGLAGAGVTDNSVLGIISFAGDYSFDASDRDIGISIRNQRCLGMFLPDAIASYEVDGVVYIITANEGDSRDYDGYSEEERVKDLDLDPTVFPYASTLQQDENMGRLKTTSSMGDLDGDGDFDEIYSFGGRSFSIFDQYGNLVWDAGNQFSTIIKAMEPNLFNEDGGEMDGRSDDKGGEPEAMAIGKIGVYTYAFIGLERQSCIMVYDITDPKKPIFITYYSNRMVNGTNVSGDVGPEIIKFIPATASPNGENLLLVGYEVSGSLGVIQVGGELLMSISETLRNPIGFKAYPNPAQGGVVHFNKTITAEVYDYQGRMITSFEDQSEINTEGWTQGIYTIRSSENGTIRILVLP